MQALNIKKELNSLSDVFTSPPLSPRNGVENYAAELFEKNISEALGFSNGQREYLDIKKEGGMFGLIVTLWLYERSQKIYDGASSGEFSFEGVGNILFQNMLEISQNVHGKKV